MPPKHISPSANTSNPLSNCPHALKTHFTECQQFKPPFQLPSCPQKIFHPMPTQQTHFAAAPMPSKQISHGASTSNPLFNCPRAPKTHFIQCQHLKPPLQLPPCPQTTFHPVATPQTPFSPARMPPRHISSSANTSNPLFNYPHALKTHFTQCQHIKPPFQLPPCPLKIISPSADTSDPLFYCPHALKTYFPSANSSNPLFNSPHALKAHLTKCQDIKPPFQQPVCPEKIFHPVPTPQTPFSTAPMP